MKSVSHPKLPPYLAPVRLRPTSQKGRSPREETLSDKARIITSSSFRRLQTKAQVFSLEENAAVRSRLTHTLEVAVFGELIATRAFELLEKKKKLPESAALPFIQTVENACYLHDIGNPPFGHLGEFAVREWFRSHEQDVKDWWKASGVSPTDADLHFESFRHFDGNSQGFRIVSKLQWLTDEFGLNLTCPLLAAMVKYLAPRPVHARQFGKKAGFFEIERERILQVWKKLGLRTEYALPAQRHPLAFLMEAADDIAYCVSDIEDALEKGVLTADDLRRELPRKLARYKSAKGGRPKHAAFIDYRVELTRALVNIAGDAFAKHYDKIVAGEYDRSLFKDHKDAESDLKALKILAAKHIFAARETVTIELSGHRILSCLLDRFAPLLGFSTEAFRRLWPENIHKLGSGELALERRLASLLPGKHFLNYQHETRLRAGLEPVNRTHLIVDYIAGMTDRHAVKIFRMLEGDLAGDLA